MFYAPASLYVEAPNNEHFIFQFGQASVDVSGMGNKPSNSQSEAEEPEVIGRLPPSGRHSSRARRSSGGHQEDGDDLEVPEVPPPMRPISSMPTQDDPASSVKRVSDIRDRTHHCGQVDVISGKVKCAQIPLKKSDFLRHWFLSDIIDIVILRAVLQTPTQSSTKNQ